MVKPPNSNKKLDLLKPQKIYKIITLNKKWSFSKAQKKTPLAKPRRSSQTSKKKLGVSFWHWSHTRFLGVRAKGVDEPTATLPGGETALQKTGI